MTESNTETNYEHLAALVDLKPLLELMDRLQAGKGIKVIKNHLTELLFYADDGLGQFAENGLINIVEGRLTQTWAVLSAVRADFRYYDTVSKDDKAAILKQVRRIAKAVTNKIYEGLNE